MVIATVLAAGCGGGGSSELTDPAAQTARIGPAGGQLVDSADGVVVTIPAGALATDTTVAMNVTRTHAPAVAQMAEGGRVLSELGVQLTLSPAAFATSGAVTVAMPLTGRYDPVDSIMAVASPANVVLAIPSLLSGDGKSLIGTLDAATASALAAASGSAATLEVFTATSPLRLTSAPARGATLRFAPPSGVTDCGAAPRSTPPPAPPCWVEIRAGDLAHKRVALLVHGFMADLGKIQTLAFHLRDYPGPVAAPPYYDAVIGFDYDTSTGIAAIGTLMAQQVAPLLQEEGTVVDVFAHSMGVVVARYAMETTSLPARLGPKVSHFVALGGPDYETARYFSLSGDGYKNEVGPPPKKLPVGEIVNAAYVLAVGPIVNDGLVAAYSAQSDALARQSKNWVKGPTLSKVSHYDLHEAAAFPTIDGWIASF